MSTAPATPTIDAKSITEIERLGFTYRVEPQFDLDQLDPSRRVQVRETNHYAPREAVERYSVQMQFSQFPAVIVTADDWIVDGNTRVGASQLRKQKFFPAIVLDAKFKGGGAKQEGELYALAATLNATNGEPLTRREIRAVTQKFVALGWKADQIARAVGIKTNTVTAVGKEIRASAKLRRVGMDPNGSLKGASLRALGSGDAVTLNDIPFRDLAQLAADAGLNMGEISTIAKEVKALGADTLATDRLQEKRAEMADRIREQELTGRAKPPLSARLRQSLGAVVKYKDHEGYPEVLLETNPDAYAKHVTALQESIEVLTKVLERQPRS